MYDASGPFAINANGTTYYYVKNVQGDITAILNKAGTAVVTYSYDAWGNPLATTGTLATTLGTLNPLRYRGYVYDTETGFYYLQSRYYDPQIGRFINADALVATGQGLLGNNMFAYCLNSPVVLCDFTGAASVIALTPERSIEGSPFKDVTTGGGEVSAAFSTALTIYLATMLTDKAELDAALREKIKKTGGDDRRYIVYFLCAKGDMFESIVYVGRVTIEGFNARMAYHESKGRQLVFFVPGLTYGECRGLEQGGMILCHTINRFNPLHNQIRGVSPRNDARGLYLEALRAMRDTNLSSKLNIPIDYISNLTENEFLNGFR